MDTGELMKYEKRVDRARALRNDSIRRRGLRKKYKTDIPRIPKGLSRKKQDRMLRSLVRTHMLYAPSSEIDRFYLRMRRFPYYVQNWDEVEYMILTGEVRHYPKRLDIEAQKRPR